MARTKLTPVEIAAAGIATNAGATIDATLVTNGAYFIPTEPAEEYFLRVTNTHGTAHNVTIPAGDNPPASMASKGALVKAVALTSGDVLIPLEGARHIQQGAAAEDDGTVHIDFVTDHAGAITVYHLPRL